MDWEIMPFVGIGPIKFGMTVDQVSTILGKTDDADSYRDGHLREIRDVDQPIITYQDNQTAEIEAFYDMKDVSFEGNYIFRDDPLKVLRYLEGRNNGVLEHLGTLLFNNLGIALGRIDESVVEEHNLSIYRKGAWDERIGNFKPISFLR
jgi:hypothetical protein